MGLDSIDLEMYKIVFGLKDENDLELKERKWSRIRKRTKIDKKDIR